MTNRTCEIIIYFDPKKVVKDMKKGKPAKNTMAISFIGHTTMAHWATSKEGRRILNHSKEFYVKMYGDRVVGDHVDYRIEYGSYYDGEARKDVFIDLEALANNEIEKELDENYFNSYSAVRKESH